METFNALLSGSPTYLNSFSMGKNSIQIDPNQQLLESQNHIENAKSFQCTEEGCGKFFSSLSNLTRHSLIHSGERPYGCEHCDKRFNQQGNLRKHLKSHENAHLRWNRNTTDKPFKCPVPQCHRSFTVKSSLQNHLLSHQEVPPSLPYNMDLNMNHQLVVKTKREPTYSSILGQYDTVSSSMLGNTVIKSRCLHNGCAMVFDTQRDLRSHLFAHAPGLAAEFKAMTNTMLNLIQMIETWDIKTPQEKVKSLQYVGTVKKTITDYPLLTDAPKLPEPNEIEYIALPRPDYDKFETFTIHDVHEEGSVYTTTSASTTSEHQYSVNSMPNTIHSASPNSYSNFDSSIDDSVNDDISNFLNTLGDDSNAVNDELRFLESLLESNDDLISDYTNGGFDTKLESIPVCMDCKPSNKVSSSLASSAASTVVQNKDEIEEIQRYGSIANNLASPLLEARNEIIQGWAEHLIPATVPVEEYNADNGRKRRIVN